MPNLVGEAEVLVNSVQYRIITRMLEEDDAIVSFVFSCILNPYKKGDFAILQFLSHSNMR